MLSGAQARRSVGTMIRGLSASVAGAGRGDGDHRPAAGPLGDKEGAR
jgi:hypothetical protein